MPKILLIGKEVKTYSGALSLRGYEVHAAASVSNAMNHIGKSDLLIINKSHEGSFKELFQSSRHIPKLIISSEHSSGDLAHWYKEPLTYSLYMPSEKELFNFIERLTKEKRLLDEDINMRNEFDLVKKELGFFEEINAMLTSSTEPHKILVMIMKKIKEMVNAEAWSIIMVDEDTGDLVFEEVSGKARKQVKKIRLKPGEGIAGWVAQEGVPVVVPDVSKDKRFSSRVDRETHFTTKSLMCVPLKSKNKILGILEVINKITGEPFDEHDLAFLLRLVNQAAFTLERASLYQKMEELVVTDDLTKLFNSRYLDRTIETEVMRSNRYHTSLALIFMDIDYFKLINDNYGHLVGSKVLVEVGQILINQLRSIDIVARYGGDEFVLVLPQTSPSDAVRIAERIRKAIEQNTFLKKEGYNLKMTSSFGVASYPESAKTKEELLRIADEAMYRVKHSTRNGVFAII